MKIEKLFCIVFITIWSFLIILNFVIPTPKFSEVENRMMMTIPNFSFESLVDGTYSQKLDSYINDHFVFRNTFLKIKSTSEIVTMKKENNDVYIGENGYLFEKKTKIDFDNVDLSLDIINKFCDNTEKKVYFTLIPTSSYVNYEMMPNNAPSYNQDELIDYVLQKLNKNINFVDVRNTVKSNKDSYIYFKTDHHMTTYGSFLIYNQILSSIQNKTHSLSDYIVDQVCYDFLGTLDSKAQIMHQQRDTIEKYEIGKIEKIVFDGKNMDSIYNEDYLNKKDKYSYFLDANHSVCKIETTNTSKENLLIIKDSYANNMVGLMIDDFHYIHVIDPRYYRASITEYVNKNNIDVVLFIYNTSNFIDELGIRNLK